MFILHGILLTGYLLIYALEQIIFYAAEQPMESIDTYLILRGIIDVLIPISNLTEMITFFLVVKLMLPITRSDKEARSKF